MRGQYTDLVMEIANVNPIDLTRKRGGEVKRDDDEILAHKFEFDGSVSPASVELGCTPLNFDTSDLAA